MLIGDAWEYVENHLLDKNACSDFDDTGKEALETVRAYIKEE
jgi:hypothetical protein